MSGSLVPFIVAAAAFLAIAGLGLPTVIAEPAAAAATA